MASEFPVPRSSLANAPTQLIVSPMPQRGTSNVTKASEFIIRMASRAERYGEFPPDRRDTLRSHPIRRSVDAEAKAKRSEDLIEYAREGQQARAEELAERLELAIDTLLESKLSGGQAGDVVAKRSILFELYERGILTRDQVRRRGDLDPADFYEELQAYRLHQTAC